MPPCDSYPPLPHEQGCLPGRNQEESRSYRRGVAPVQSKSELDSPPIKSDSSHRRKRSAAHRRYTSGFQEKLYGDHEDESSDPDLPASRRDRFRDDVDQRKRLPMDAKPHDSQFTTQYRELKNSDDDAKAYSQSNKDLLNPKVGSIARAQLDSPVTPGRNPRANAPDRYEASDRAQTAAQKYELAIDQRREMAKSFVGYDKQDNYYGHQTRIDNLDTSQRYTRGLSEIYKLPLSEQRAALAKHNKDEKARHDERRRDKALNEEWRRKEKDWQWE